MSLGLQRKGRQGNSWLRFPQEGRKKDFGVGRKETKTEEESKGTALKEAIGYSFDNISSFLL